MNLNNTLLVLLHGNPSRQEINTIIQVAISHARSYIRWLIWNRNYSISPLGLTLDDLAYDLIAELVSEIDGENLQRLRSSITDIYHEDAEDDIDVESAFKAVVCRNVQINLARLFMEIHPVRARLLRSLRRYEKNHPSITRHDGLAGYWYSYASQAPRLELPSVPADIIRSMTISIGPHHHPTHAVLHQLLAGIARYPEYRQAAAEDDILELTLRLIQTDQTAATPDQHDDELDPEINASIMAESVLQTIPEIRIWVMESYVLRSKLLEDEAEAMLEAIQYYVTDLAQGRDQGHLYYLRRTIPALTQEVYRKRYRSTYEYIIRTVFAKARGRLQLYHEQQDTI